MPNRLATETSPYLLQHAENPVDWFPWCEEALARAKSEDRPIFLSIGYSACHWCHVMEHESFENEHIAEVLNRDFVCIKVDREERPDLDQIYMLAVQIMTGRGGWPMSVFLTPDLHPFFGGTYWPASPRMGMPGFGQVLDAVVDAWRNRRAEAVTKSQELTHRIQQLSQPTQGAGEVPGPQLLPDAAAQLQRQFDFQHGGFGTAPKFPHAIDLQLLLRVWRRTGEERLREMVCLNLDMMARGGIYDHLAGGFARYAVDERWLVPHFEKMLYDNALLSSAYLDAYLATHVSSYADVARATVDYVLAYMTDEQGGFHSTEDADSEGEEGKFYVWTPTEIREVLGDELGERFCDCYDVTPSGNFEGKNILNLPKTLAQIASLKGWDEQQLESDLADARTRLREVRDRRVRPGKDDKVLVSWNGLMIDAAARAGSILDEPRYVQAATAAAEFIDRYLRRDDGRLLHSWRRGQARFDAYLDDYACFANALVTLYEATFHEPWVDIAVDLVTTMLSHFKDPDGEGFFYTADDHEQLIARQKDLYDSSVPSGSAMAATVLTRLGKLCGRADFLMAARETLALGTAVMQQSPTAAGQMLIALDMIQGPFWEVALVGDTETEVTREVLHDLRQRYLPNKVVACRRSADQEHGSVYLDPIFLGRHLEGNSPAVFVCEKFVCGAPVIGKEAILEKWHQLERQTSP